MPWLSATNERGQTYYYDDQTMEVRWELPSQAPALVVEAGAAGGGEQGHDAGGAMLTAVMLVVWIQQALTYQYILRRPDLDLKRFKEVQR